jgi:hypothetical protein
MLRAKLRHFDFMFHRYAAPILYGLFFDRLYELFLDRPGRREAAVLNSWSY